MEQHLTQASPRAATGRATTWFSGPVLWLVFVAACGGPASRPETPSHAPGAVHVSATRPERDGTHATRLARNVILIVVDSLRSDYVTAERMPHLARLAADGTRGELHAAVPSCLSAVATMFIGLTPDRLGHLSLSGSDPAVPELAWTVPELLRCDGIHTALFAANHHIDESSGAAQGFEHVENAARSSSDTSATAVLASAGTWIRGRGASRFFAYVHLLEPHLPYDPPAPFAPERPRDAVAAEATARWVADVQRGAHEPTTEEQEWVTTLYAAEVRAVDAALGAFLARLAADGLLADTLVLVVADHGEHLGGAGDLGEFGHASSSPATSRVPFVAFGPSRPPHVPADATLANVAPTVLEALGVTLPDRMEAASLGPRGLLPPATSSPVHYTALPAGFTHEQCVTLRRLGYLLPDTNCDQYPTPEGTAQARFRAPNVPCE